MSDDINMTPEERAKEFVAGAFGPFGVRLEPYNEIIKELIEGALVKPEQELEHCREILRQAVEAYDNGYLQMDSPDLGDPEVGVLMHPWHEEWLHHARAAIGMEK